MPKIKVNDDRIINYDSFSKKSLFDILIENNIDIEGPCNGKGICGKCVVEHRGIDDKISEEEKAFHIDIKKERLACCVFPSKDIEIKIKTAEENYHRVSEKNYTDENIYLAVDIGTTTVEMEAFEALSKKTVFKVNFTNPQKDFGSDVLTRLTYISSKERGLEIMQQRLVKIMDMELSDIKHRIKKVFVSANSIMTHIFLKTDCSDMGRYPYTLTFKDMQEVDSKDLGFSFSAKLYTMPLISAFIGGDIVSGALSSGIYKEKENALFIDIGTNGEILLKSNDKLYASSCAAGPALEGMNITRGSRAKKGAVEDVKITEEEIKLDVIGRVEAESICGSGILAFIRELVKNGLIDKRGRFVEKTEFKDCFREVNGEKVFYVSPKIYMSRKDLRNVQLSKTAIYSAILALLRKAGLEAEDIKKVYVAGQFGSHLTEDMLIYSGIFPKEFASKTIYCKNTSLKGAKEALINEEKKEKLKDIIKNVEFLELSKEEDYDRLFIRASYFPQMGEDL